MISEILCAIVELRKVYLKHIDPKSVFFVVSDYLEKNISVISTVDKNQLLFEFRDKLFFFL